jgi:hypothetical protein
VFDDNVIQSVAVFIGAISLAVGVFDARQARKHAQSQNSLQAMIPVYTSFREKWESEWEDILEQCDLVGRDQFYANATAADLRRVRRMLNWVDWLGTLKATGAVDDITVLTDGIGPALRRILECGQPMIEADVKTHGVGYWKNLMLVGTNIGACWTQQLLQPR